MVKLRRREREFKKDLFSIQTEVKIERDFWFLKFKLFLIPAYSRLFKWKRLQNKSETQHVNVRSLVKKDLRDIESVASEKCSIRQETYKWSWRHASQFYQILGLQKILRMFFSSLQEGHNKKVLTLGKIKSNMPFAGTEQINSWWIRKPQNIYGYFSLDGKGQRQCKGQY